MHVPQIRSIRVDPAARRHVCHGPQRNQRKDLHLLMVLVRFLVHMHLSRPDMEDTDSIPPLQEQEIQPDDLRERLSWEIEPLERSNGVEILQLHRLVVLEVPVEEYRRDGVQGDLPRLGGGAGGEGAVEGGSDNERRGQIRLILALFFYFTAHERQSKYRQNYHV